MPRTVQGILAVLGRVLLCTIFFMAAVGNNIPNFQAVAGYMAKEGVPAPQFMLVGAIVFLIAGSISIILGYKARIGAFLLLVFLALATYFFHDFWTLSDPQARQEQMIQFMKNLGLMGAMLIVIANGTGPMSLDRRKEGGLKNRRRENDIPAGFDLVREEASVNDGSYKVRAERPVAKARP